MYVCMYVCMYMYISESDVTKIVGHHSLTALYLNFPVHITSLAYIFPNLKIF